MQITVIGASLCAQVTAAALASTGNQIELVVTDSKHLAALNTGKSLWQEAGLSELLNEQQAAGRLTLSSGFVPQNSSNHIFLALEANQFELAQQLVSQFADLPQAEVLLINQSTFPVGSSNQLNELLLTGKPKNPAKRQVVSLPDLLQEGSALAGFTRPNSILLGSASSWAETQVREILRPFNRRSDNLLVMQPQEAEFTKLAITGMLATRLSYMNDMANLADNLGVDIEAVRQGMGADPRIGEHYLYPGCGFGGLSFSRDVISLASTLASSNPSQGSQLLNQVLSINEQQKELLFRKLWQLFNADLRGKTFALWGLAFKPGSDRIDNAPVLKLLESLWAQGAKVKVHDPQALKALAEWASEREDFKAENLELCTCPYAAADQAEALLVVTEWKAYWSPDFNRLKQLLKQPIILDGRNIYDPSYLKSLGFTYQGVGRG